MRLVATEKAHQNQAVIDPWSAVHFATGLAAGLANVDRVTALSAAVLYEALEQDLERRELGKEVFNVSGPESVANAVADVLFFAAGHVIGELWNRTGR